MMYIKIPGLILILLPLMELLVLLFKKTLIKLGLMFMLPKLVILHGVVLVINPQHQLKPVLMSGKDLTSIFSTMKLVIIIMMVINTEELVPL